MASLQNKIVDFLSKTHAGKEEFRGWKRNPFAPTTTRSASSTTNPASGLTSRTSKSDIILKINTNRAAKIAQDVVNLKDRAMTNNNSADRLKVEADTLNDDVTSQVSNVHEAETDNDFSSILIASIALERLHDLLVLKRDECLKLHGQQEQIKNQATTLQQEILKITESTDIINRHKASVTDNIALIDQYKSNVYSNYSLIQQNVNTAEEEASDAADLKSSAPFLVAAPMANDNTIQKQNDEIDATFSTKYTQILYQEERNKTAKLVVYWVNIVYYILGCVLVYFLIFSEKTAKMVWQYKLLYTIIIAVFPFVIVTIELYIKQVLEMLYVTILGKPYEPSKWKVMGEPEFNKKSPGYGIPDEEGHS
jgi:hypothetical protein